MARVPSQSTPGCEYEITLGFDGSLACNCPAFAFSKAKPKDCKHLGIYRDGRGQSVANSDTNAPEGDTMMAGLIRLTDLWTKTREPGGEQYLEGPLGDARLVIVRNTEKASATDPHFIAYAAPAPRRDLAG